MTDARSPITTPRADSGYIPMDEPDAYVFGLRMAVNLMEARVRGQRWWFFLFGRGLRGEILREIESLRTGIAIIEGARQETATTP